MLFEMLERPITISPTLLKRKILRMVTKSLVEASENLSIYIISKDQIHAGLSSILT